MWAKALSFFTSTSLFLALNASLTVAFGFFLYGHAIAFEIILAAFLVTFSVYTLNKATDKTEDAINKPAGTQTNTKHYVIASILAMIGCLIIGVVDGPCVFLVLLSPVIIGVIYSVKVAKNLPRLKEIVGVKSLAVAVSWATTGALLPASFQTAAPEKIILVFTYIFIQLLVNTILFDSLDMKGDRASGVTTIPMVLGKHRTKKFLTAINTSLSLWLIYCLLRGIFTLFMPALVFGFLYTYLIIWLFMCKNKVRLHAELMIDGQWLPIVTIIRLILH